MRVQTIEKLISLNEIFPHIKNIINTSFEVDENSYTDDLSLLIIGINRKDQSIVIRGSVNKSRNRTSFSILVLQNNQVPKDINSPKQPLGKTLYNFVKTNKENKKNYVFTNLKIKKIKEKNLQNQLIEIEKEISMKFLDLLREKYNYNNGLMRKYHFSLIDIDGSWEIWYDIYDQYIDLIENKFITANNSSLKIFRNYDFALENAFSQRIMDLIISEEEPNLDPTSKSPDRIFKIHNNFQNQNLDEVEKKAYNLKITFIFTHKKKTPLRLIQMLKLLEEVKNFTHLMHKKDFKRYNHILPQIIFISLFGFEQSVGKYLKDNLYGNLSDRISIIAIPPIDNKIWNNYFIYNSSEEDEYIKRRSNANLAKYNNLRRNNAVNKNAIIKMDTQYQDLRESKRVSDQNSQQLNKWIDILSIDDCSEQLDVTSAREKIQKAII